MAHDSVRFSRESLHKARPKEWIPHLFGRGGRDRVLICLAVNGPMGLRRIARTVDSLPSAVFAVLEKLLDQGVVVQQQMPPRKYGGYIALNRALPIYPALRNLLLALDRRWPVQRLEKPAHYRRHMPYDATMRQQLFEIFCSPIRSRVLLFAAAVGLTDLKMICQTLDVTRFSAHDAVQRWQREGALRSQRVGRRRLISLDPNFAAADELRTLLCSLIKHSAQWRELRAIGRRNLRQLSREVSKNHARGDDEAPGS